MAAEALILSMIRKLECRQGGMSCLGFCMTMIPYFFDVKKWVLELTIKEETKVIDELRLIVDILVDKKLGQGRRLDYFISDLVDMAQEALDLYQLDMPYAFYTQMESIQSWIIEIKTRMLRFGDDGVETESNMRSENVGEGDHDEDEDVVGLEKVVQLLLRTKISKRGGFLSTLFIKGMAGVGKTTLARQLYNNVAVVDQFNRRAWVCISTDLTLKEVLIKLIRQVVDSEEFERDSLLEKMEHADNRSLQHMLHKHLQGVRYFIVLDDLPKKMHLQSIRRALPDEVNGSILLLTSHTMSKSTKLAVHDVHRMEPLDPNTSWKLFLKTINFGNKLRSEHKFPKHLEKKGREMLRKCGGLPLAIKEVGRQLAEKRQLGSEWDQLLESIDLGSTLEKLEVFYHKLDPKLQSCFLHLAFYKENTTMREQKLTQIWVAGGGASESECESDLKELINESVIGIKDKSTRYCINIVLHGLSIKKAKEEIGFEILRNDGNSPPSQSPRHRVIVCSRDKFNYSTDQDKHLVSLFFHGGGYLDASPSFWKGLEQLKILDLEDFGIKILPESIGTLMELRYLGLRNNYIQELPHSLRCLKKLEVLDIALNFMVEVPNIIWEMDSLHHLYISDMICQKPLKIEAMQKLQTLTYISVDNWTYKLSGLLMMSGLCKLGIEELDEKSNVSKLFASLAKLEDLQHLILRGYRYRTMPCLDKLGILRYSLSKLKLDGLLPTLPNSFPRFIKTLKLVNSSLEEDPMPVLEKLLYLKHLKLENAYIGQEMVISHKGFLSLKIMYIKELCNLRNVQVEQGAMYWLEILEIHNCSYLETLPEEIGTMTHLKQLKMVTTKNVATKIRRSALFSKMRSRVVINPYI